MNKGTEKLRDNVIREIFLLVEENNERNVLSEKTSAICQKYFPETIVLENSFVDFARCFQSLKIFYKVINFELNRYEREKRKN